MSMRRVKFDLINSVSWSGNGPSGKRYHFIKGKGETVVETMDIEKFEKMPDVFFIVDRGIQSEERPLSFKRVDTSRMETVMDNNKTITSEVVKPEPKKEEVKKKEVK